MKLKGIDKFREKLPMLSGKKIVIIPIYVITVLILFISLIRYIYSLPGMIEGVMTNFIPIFGIFLIEIIAIFLVYQVWLWRDELKEKYGQTSYQRIVFVGFGGIIIKIFLAFNNYFSLNNTNMEYWSSFPASIWVKNFLAYFLNDISNYSLILKIIAIIIMILGILTLIRSLFTFGFDYMTVVYLYFPEESEIQEHKIYSILRHPTYMSMILVCFGGFVYNFNLFSLLYFAIYFTGFAIHIVFVEEKELIVRFGESFKTYRDSVPAVFVRPKNWLAYFKFIFGK